MDGMLVIHMVARREEHPQRNSTRRSKRAVRARPDVINFADDEPIFPVIPTAATGSGDSCDSLVINLVDDSPIAKGSRRRRGRRNHWGGRSDNTRGR